MVFNYIYSNTSIAVHMLIHTLKWSWPVNSAFYVAVIIGKKGSRLIFRRGISLDDFYSEKSFHFSNLHVNGI